LKSRIYGIFAATGKTKWTRRLRGGSVTWRPPLSRRPWRVSWRNLTQWHPGSRSCPKGAASRGSGRPTGNRHRVSASQNGSRSRVCGR